MTEAVGVADKIHTPAADPSGGLGNFLADVKRSRAQYSDVVVTAALATELMTVATRLAARTAPGGSSNR